MYSLIRPLLFCLDAESSHNLVMGMLGLISKSPLACRATGLLNGAGNHFQPVSAMGITFPNPVGLAAGLDKQGTACNALHQLGFGFLELGTVTPQPQPGNPKPRMFRLVDDEAIINRTGFNSVGLVQFTANVSRTLPGIIKGINIGKNAATPMNRAVDDYLEGLRGVYDYADYVAINISSPNTRNLRDLHEDEALDQLLGALNRQRNLLAHSSGIRKPLAVKIAPDLDPGQINNIAALARKHAIDGIIATNTTISRPALNSHPQCEQPGGLSGKPLGSLSTDIIDALYRNLQGEIPVIGVGGIDDAESAMEKFQAGARLIQLYTGFVYQGPGLISRILERLEEKGATPPS